MGFISVVLRKKIVDDVKVMEGSIPLPAMKRRSLNVTLFYHVQIYVVYVCIDK